MTWFTSAPKKSIFIESIFRSQRSRFLERTLMVLSLNCKINWCPIFFGMLQRHRENRNSVINYQWHKVKCSLFLRKKNKITNFIIGEKLKCDSGRWCSLCFVFLYKCEVSTLELLWKPWFLSSWYRISQQHLWPTCLLLLLHGLRLWLLHGTAVHAGEDKRLLRGHH